MKDIAIFAVDIETSGPSFSRNGIIAIGYCVGLLDGTVISKKRICMDLPENSCFNERCWTTFWNFQQDILKELQQNTVTPELGIREFSNDLHIFEQLYNLKIVSDNPVFDIGFINYYLDKYLNDKPMYYTRDGLTYRTVYDMNSYNFGVCHQRYDQPTIEDSEIIEKFGIDLNNVIHDHRPENDAHYIYEFHRQMMNV